MKLTIDIPESLYDLICNREDLNNLSSHDRTIHKSIREGTEVRQGEWIVKWENHLLKHICPFCHYKKSTYSTHIYSYCECCGAELDMPKAEME